MNALQPFRIESPLAIVEANVDTRRPLSSLAGLLFSFPLSFASFFFGLARDIIGKISPICPACPAEGRGNFMTKVLAEPTKVLPQFRHLAAKIVPRTTGAAGTTRIARPLQVEITTHVQIKVCSSLTVNEVDQVTTPACDNGAATDIATYRGPDA